MPIDPSIPLSVRPFQSADPFRAMDYALRVRQQKRLEQQLDIQSQREAEQVRKEQEASKVQETLGKAYQEAASVSPTGEIKLDRQRLLTSIPPQLWGSVSAELDKADTASLNRQKTQAEIAKLQREDEDAKAEMVSRWAYGVDQAGNTPEGWDWLVKQAKSHQAVTDEELAPFQETVAKDPSQIASFTKLLMTRGPKGKGTEDFTLSEGQTRFGPGGQVIAKGAEKTAPNPTQSALALRAASGDAEAQAALDLMKKDAAEKNPTMATLALQAAQGDKQAARAVTLMRQPMGGGGTGPLKRVSYKDPDTGENVIEYLTDAEIRDRQKGGQKFQAPTGATVQSRLVSAKAMYQTGEDIVKQASDPKVKALLGPAMGRFNTLREFIGNPPPELSELAGQIESYGQLALGVHGMRSGALVSRITNMLDQKHTPDALVATIKGLSAASRHLLENEGMGSAVKSETTAAPAGPAAGGIPLSYADYLKGKK